MVRNVSVSTMSCRAIMISRRVFCLWLTDEDYDAIGEQLRADYDALSRDFTVAEQGKPHFAGHGSANSDALAASQSPLTPRAQGRVPP